jgi:hypothetical protein
MRLTGERLRAALVPVTSALAWRGDEAEDDGHVTLQPDDVVLLPEGGVHEEKLQEAGREWKGRLHKDGCGGLERLFPMDAVVPLAAPLARGSDASVLRGEELERLTGPGRPAWPLALSLRTRQVTSLSDGAFAQLNGSDDGSEPPGAAIVCVDLRNNRLRGEGLGLATLGRLQVSVMITVPLFQAGAGRGD